jgi:menaquinone-dependent protoporphyrinogen oxidase
MKEETTNRKAISRRRFLKTAGIVLGAGVVACGSGAYFSLKTPASVDFPETSCSEGGKKRVLVTYVSKCGATAETADYISRSLCSMGCEVDLLQTRDVKDVSGYQAIILGSAVYMGKLLGEAKRFTAKFLAALSNVPVACFVVCLAMKEKTAENTAKALDYLNPLQEYINPAAIAAFPGRIELDTLPPFYRMIAKADSEGILAAGDFRDWDAVSAWVNALPAGFLPV